MAIFIVLVLTTHEQGSYFNSLVSCSVSFFKDSKLLLQISFNSLVWIPRRYLFEAIVSGSVSITYFSVCLLLVHRKICWFCKVILYLAALLKLLTICWSSLVEFWDLNIISSTRKNNKISLFSCYLIPFSFLIVSASSILLRSGDNIQLFSFLIWMELLQDFLI